MSCSLATTRRAWTSYNSTHSITIAANLLYHERPLPYGLEPSTSTCSTFAHARSWLSLAALASATEVGPSKRDLLLCSINCIHEFNFYLKQDVFSLLSGLLLFLLAALASTKELFKLFKNISKWLATLTSLLSELVWNPSKPENPPKPCPKPPNGSPPACYYSSPVIPVLS